MKNKFWCISALMMLLLIMGTGCQPRSIPTENPSIPSDNQESSNQNEASVQQSNPDETQMHFDGKDLQILLGDAFHQNASQVVSLKVSSADSGEVLYQTEDDVLTQRFRDSVYIVNKTMESPISPNYNVEFNMKTGEMVLCSMQIDTTSDGAICVERDGTVWELPAMESAWIRSQLDLES